MSPYRNRNDKKVKVVSRTLVAEQIVLPVLLLVGLVVVLIINKAISGI